jgi:hypothetical protein
MQTLTWYARRLGRMSPAEIVWRGQSALRDAGDRLRYSIGWYPSMLPATPRALAGNPNEGEASTSREPLATSKLIAMPVGSWASRSPDDAWRQSLVRTADALVAHRFSFLNLEDAHLGDPIDWNRDHETGQATPGGFAGAIDYRDPASAGDAKLVWEPGRHLQLPVLGRAYRATGDPKYVSAALDQIDSWIRACPLGTGMHWRSPLEVAIRAINWTWFLALAEPSGLIAGAARSQLLHALDCHVWEVTRKYSRGSSANNHRIGEAAGVFIATSSVPALSGAAAHRQQSRDILAEEILAQNHADGGNREQAFGYHLFVLQFLILARLTAERTGQLMPQSFDDRLSAMVEFAAAVTDAGPAPMYGDADDGYVVDLGGRELGGRELVAAGRALLGRQRAAHDDDAEPLRWMFGPTSGQLRVADPPVDPPQLECQAFPDTGLYLLQWGRRGQADSASASLDCGALGFGAIAAHGHADALSVTLRAFGEDVLVDPGTYDYFRFPAWRDYFRSTRAHNTIVIDDLDQSTMLGPFMWGERATSRCLDWQGHGPLPRIVAEHDGYARLPDPVVHRRTLEMDGDARTFAITDSLQMAGEHRLRLFFHLSEHARVKQSGASQFLIALAGGTVTLDLDSRLTATMREGCEEPIGGWVSRGYHRKAPAMMIEAAMTGRGPTTLRSRVQITCGAAR